MTSAAQFAKALKGRKVASGRLACCPAPHRRNVHRFTDLKYAGIVDNRAVGKRTLVPDTEAKAWQNRKAGAAQ